MLKGDILHDLLRDLSKGRDKYIHLLLRIDPTIAQLTTGLNAEAAQTYDYYYDNYGLGMAERMFSGASGESILGDKILPIHQAVINEGKTLKTLKLLVEAFPQGLRHVDTKGNTPLHYAIRDEDSSDAKRRYLIEADPAAAAMKSSNGSFPLHFPAAEYGNSSLATFRKLYEAYPDAVRQENNKGKLPLELASEGKHRQLSRMLRRVYNPPPKPTKASLWVIKTYGNQHKWVNISRLASKPPPPPSGKKKKRSNDEVDEKNMPAKKKSTVSTSRSRVTRATTASVHRNLAEEDNCRKPTAATATVSHRQFLKQWAATK